MVVLTLNNQWYEQSVQLAKDCGLPTVLEPPMDYYFIFEEDGLVVRDGRQGKNFSLKINVDKEVEKIKKQKISYKKDLLCKAVGFKKQEDWTVLDGCFGLGKDALHLYSFGCKILGCEVNPVTYQFMQRALAQSSLDSGQIELVCGDTLDLLPTYYQRIDCLYLDPMFENTKKKSAPKKQLAFLREIAISTGDVQRVMELAEKLEIKRIVVKRPINGDHLWKSPSLSFEGNLIRYDVYTR